ncbi:MAG: hypothetical protein HRT90_02870, partial [Candidatus Margulisbacteria bacterium]|nr:hypothetical protein [Candidatus Margulisiibacteriota bacterium]
MKKLYYFLVIMLCISSNLIALIVESTNNISTYSDKILLYKSEAYTCSVAASSDFIAGTAFYNATSVPWVDISSKITKKHKALGYIDIMVTCVMTNEGNSAFDNRWRMQGDDDKRADYDFQAYADGVLYEVISSDIKYENNSDYILWGNSGDFKAIRFQVPETIGNEYKIF